MEHDWNAALQLYYRAAEIKSSSYLYHLIAEQHILLGQADKAIQSYQRAIALAQVQNGIYTPDMSRLGLARLLVDQKQWDRAKQELDAIILNDPSSIEVYQELAVIYYRGYGDFRKAEELLGHAKELDPKAAKTYLLGGSFNRSQERYTEARDWLTAGLSLPPNDWTPWMHGELGRLYMEQESYDAAIQELEAVVAAVPTDTWFLELTGDAYLKGGNAYKARERYQMVLDLDSTNGRVAEKLSNLDSRQ